jgi:predicted transcriptional regulator
LLEIEKSSDTELSKQTKIPQPDVNRALHELKKIGLIHKAKNEHSFPVARQTRQKEKSLSKTKTAESKRFH